MGTAGTGGSGQSIFSQTIESEQRKKIVRLILKADQKHPGSTQDNPGSKETPGLNQPPWLQNHGTNIFHSWHPFRTFSLRLENNNTLKCSSEIFLKTLRYVFIIEKCWNFISRYYCPLKAGKRSKMVLKVHAHSISKCDIFSSKVLAILPNECILSGVTSRRFCAFSRYSRVFCLFVITFEENCL